VVLLIGAWELLTAVVFPGRHVVPAPVSVVATAVRDGFYLSALRTTLWEALRGFLIGNLAALILAVVALFVPRLARLLAQFGAITYCVPTVAVGPLLLVFLDPDTTKVIMAALSVFFVSLVAWTTGLRAAEPVALDVVHAYGGGRMDELLRVRLRAALPSASGGLALSAPAAILGAIIGEYLGGTTGLGVAMVSAEQQFQVSRTWAIGLVATAVSGLAYAAVLLVVRRFGGAPPVGTGSAAATEPVRGVRGWVAQALAPLVTLAVLVLVWAGADRALGLSSYFAKTPAAVWSYLVSGAGAASHRHVVTSALLVTLRDAAGGWLVGSVAAVVAAVAVVEVARVRSVVYPVVMVLRSVPLIAMVPLITLVFGQGATGVVTIAAIVSFVPTLVLVVSGLEAVPPQALDLARAHAASRWATVARIRARYATPTIFAAAKVAMPGSILGAVLAEWLITGNGIGHLMAAALIGSDFSSLWAAVVVVSGVSLLLYEVVGILERVAEQQVAA
jgi:ABC-type nitrate/sulfonate/bicarbonate transport system permease component